MANIGNTAVLVGVESILNNKSVIKRKGKNMKKTLCLLSLMVLFSQANISAMHRKSMRKMYDRKRYQKKTKRQKFLQSRKYDTIARHKNSSREKKIDSVDIQANDNQYTVENFVKTLVPRFRINKNPLLAVFLFPIVLSSIVNSAKAEDCEIVCDAFACYCKKDYMSRGANKNSGKSGNEKK